jgi:hypothetical protein
LTQPSGAVSTLCPTEWAGMRALGSLCPFRRAGSRFYLLWVYTSRIESTTKLGWSDGMYSELTAITISDYFAASYVALGYSAYPNVKCWLDRTPSVLAILAHLMPAFRNIGYRS